MEETQSSSAEGSAATNWQSKNYQLSLHEMKTITNSILIRWLTETWYPIVYLPAALWFKTNVTPFSLKTEEKSGRRTNHMLENGSR